MVVVGGGPLKRPKTHTHGSNHGHTISKNATRFRSMFTFWLRYITSHILWFCKRLKLWLSGGYISTLDYRKIHFECIVGVGSVALGNCAISWRHGLPRYRLWVFRRKFYVCQFLELQSTKILVVEGKNTFAYDSRMKRALHSTCGCDASNFVSGWHQFGRDEVAISHSFCKNSQILVVRTKSISLRLHGRPKPVVVAPETVGLMKFSSQCSL